MNLTPSYWEGISVYQDFVGMGAYMKSTAEDIHQVVPRCRQYFVPAIFKSVFQQIESLVQLPGLTQLEHEDII